MAKSTDYSLSLMDMLCAAMGGVALMVFLFAAMRKNLEQQEGAGCLLSCKLTITSEEKVTLRVTKEIGFCICDEQEEHFAYIEDNNNAAAGSFSIKPASYASSSFSFVLSGKSIPDQVKIKVWLNDLLYDNGARRLPKKPISYKLQYNNNNLAEGVLNQEENFINVSKSFSIDF